ncbi:MAG: 4Fe-4S dicluster domain-containing protein [Deltaproteobacteria bacterium]|nr:4Fe-4S dicluster domain-containing protein [Deltaproteobacteria bacterium]
MKEEIVRYLRDQGADLVGVAPVEAWAEKGRVPEAYRPGSLWAPARSVIVIGLQMPLPLVETTPSVQHMELYRTCNRRLDDLAFDLTRWLNRRNAAAFFLSRDGYASLDILLERPAAAFAHNFAAEYAGLGTVGVNHAILTPEFGPRVRFVSVFTEVPLPPDPPLPENLCIRCGACATCCPVAALTIPKERLRSEEPVVVADYDKRLCTERHKLLVKKRCYPCGICVKVCPVGDDRRLYGRENVLPHYLREADALARDPDDPSYRAWTHVRRHGSWPLDDEPPQPTAGGERRREEKP